MRIGSIGFVASLIANLTPGQDKLRAQFDDETVTKWLESIGIICKVVSINAPSMGTGTSNTATVAVTGLTPQHRCFVSAAAALSVAVSPVGGHCTTPGTLVVDFVNASAGTLDAAAVNFNLFAVPGDLN